MSAVLVRQCLPWRYARRWSTKASVVLAAWVVLVVVTMTVLTGIKRTLYFVVVDLIESEYEQPIRQCFSFVCIIISIDA